MTEPRDKPEPIHEDDAIAGVVAVQVPSAIDRQSAALRDAGVATAELAAARGALAAVGAAAVEPELAAGSLRERLMATAARKGRYGLFADRLARVFDLSMPDAEKLAARLEDPTAWQPFIVEGVEMIPIEAGPKCAGAIATMVRLQPGARFPHHVHHGEETMFVLDGGFVEAGEASAKEEAWRGDEVVRTDDTSHELVALPGVPCVSAVIIYGHADFS